MSLSPTLAAAAIAWGAVVGSFISTAAIRFAAGRYNLLGRSHCDHCAETLNFARTVPIVSFVVSRGICHSCGGRIARTHLVGEIAGILLGASMLLTPNLTYAVVVFAIGGFAFFVSAMMAVRGRRGAVRAWTPSK